MGPDEYRRHNDAVARRIAEHFGRVDLPGQLELPDTAPRPIDHAKRMAAAPLTPSTAQKPCDIGLFSDTTKQVDLEDLL